MNTRKMIAALGIAIALAGCDGWTSTSCSNTDISFLDPSGVIGGVPWSMSVADVRRDGGDLVIELYDDFIFTCGSASSDKPKITFRVPEAVDINCASDSLPITIVEPSGVTTVVTDGVIDVTEITDSSVKIEFRIDADDRNSVNGTFVASICP